MSDTKKDLSADLERVQTELDQAVAEIAKLRTALAPFADYGRGTGRKISPDMQLTQGSNMAKRQLVMGDCHQAADAMNLR